MKNLKTYEGFFDFFKREESEDDKIVLEYIKRLRRIKDISPYEIDFSPNRVESTIYSVKKFKIKFDDTPIVVSQVLSIIGGFQQTSEDLLLGRGFIKKNKSEYYYMSVDCEGEVEKIKASATILKEIFNLCESVYKKDIESRRIRKINLNINPAADKLDPDIYDENN